MTGAFLGGLVGLLGCGGDDGFPQTEEQYLQRLPTTAQLCSLSIGAATPEQVRGVLGEPSFTTTVDLSESYQYWYGSSSDLRVLVIAFDDEGRFEFPLLTNLSMPECWRQQLMESDAQEEF